MTTDQATTARPTRTGTRGLWAMRDRPAVVWLVLALAVAVASPWLPDALWLLAHLLLLGALTHSAMVWSAYFAQALLKTPVPEDERARQNRRLVMLMSGTTLVLVGVPTAVWPLTVAGATLAATAVAWHGVVWWRRLRRALPGRFRVTIRYYCTAAACMPVGAVFGAALARGVDDAAHGQLLLGHIGVMVLGWVGLTITGTLVTFWPTILRTRIDPRAEILARQALPGFVVSILVIVAGTLLGSNPLAAAGLLLYSGSLAWWGRALVLPARTRPPRQFAPWSVGAALLWLFGSVLALAAYVARTPWATLFEDPAPWVAALAAGVGAQIMFGALSYLVPAVLGGGAAIRAAEERLDRWAVLRLVLVNGGLLLTLAPLPPLAVLLCRVAVVAGLAAFVPLLLSAVRVALAERDKPAEVRERPVESGPVLPDARSKAQLVVGGAVLAVAVSTGVGLDPAAAGLAVAGGSSANRVAVAESGHTTRVRVEAVGMRYVPDTISVPAGDRLVVELVNSDPATVHDLALPTGEKTPRLAPGESATLEAGAVGESFTAWCTVVGHRQMGMVLNVDVTGSAPAPGVAAHSGHGGAAGSSDADAPRAAATVDPSFQAVDPALAPLGTQTVHQVTMRVQDVDLEVAPGVRQKRWTFNGQVPGPVLHGRVGDVFEVTLVNDGSIGHSIDFHAGSLAPDQPMRTIAPGQSLLYRFTAGKAGVWMYHCSTMPMSAHIAAGLHGAVIIEPPALPAADRSYVLVQSEVYGAVAGPGEPAPEVDADAVSAEQPAYLTFNGVANQYDHRPFAARVGERVRFWVLNVGPNRPSSFHIVGSQFDTVYTEGAYLLREGRGAIGDSQNGGAQAMALGPAQGGFVEAVFPEAGHYPVVSHVMVDAERGAHGVVAVTP
jgi:nitrite reductase (NO-forming)